MALEKGEEDVQSFAKQNGTMQLSGHHQIGCIPSSLESAWGNTEAWSNRYGE